MFRTRKNILENISASNKNMRKKIEIKITEDFFMLVDQCINLEKLILNPETKYPIADPCRNIFPGMLLFSIILNILGCLTKDNSNFYPNNTIYYKRFVTNCYNRPSPINTTLHSFFAFPSPTVECSTQEIDFKNLSYVEIAIFILLFFYTASLSISAYITYSPNSNHVQISLDKLIALLESLDHTSRDIIFEKKMDLDAMLCDLRELLIDSFSLAKDKLKPLVRKIYNHLIEQDNQGYFSDNLIEEAKQKRMQNHLYLNVKQKKVNELTF